MSGRRGRRNSLAEWLEGGWLERAAREEGVPYPAEPPSVLLARGRWLPWTADGWRYRPEDRVVHRALAGYLEGEPESELDEGMCRLLARIGVLAVPADEESPPELPAALAAELRALQAVVRPAGPVVRSSLEADRGRRRRGL